MTPGIIPLLLGVFVNRTTAPQSDHDRLILLEQRLDLTVAQLKESIERAILMVETQDERLIAGNRRFNDLDLYQQRTDEAIVDIRNMAGASRLAADNAGRAAETLGKHIDESARTVEHKIEEAIEEAVKPLREELTALKETVTTWTVQGRLVRTISHPISGIVVAIITALIVSYLTK